jgi:hypothetical protein
MKRQSMILLSLLILACVLFSLAYAQSADSRKPMKPMTDGIRYTSGENGKWVKGCPPTPCNMGVGNLGPANTYHWEGK